jgi:hypothetical protein
MLRVDSHLARESRIRRRTRRRQSTRRSQHRGILRRGHWNALGRCARTLDAILTIQGDPGSPYIGLERLQSFFLNSGSFTNRRFSLVPSFKIQIKVSGDEAWLYFECHDVGNFDADSRFIAADAFLAGTIRRVGGRWLFWNMTAGSARPLSADHYYFP